MIRDITIGQYYPAKSVIHRMDPRTKLFGTLIFIISVFLFHSVAGNHDSLLDAADFVAAFQKRQGLYISCIEEIVYKRGFITKEQLVELAQPLLKTAYGKYLIEVAEGL